MISDDSFENITILGESMTPIANIGEDLRNIKPCVISAKDMILCSNVQELMCFSSLETSSKVLSTLIESESRLSLALQNGQKRVIDRSVSRGFSKNELHPPEKSSFCILPTLTPCEHPRTFFTQTNLHNLLKIGEPYSNSNCVIYAYFKHPLIDPFSFNSAFSEIAHLALATSNALKVDLHFQIAPLPQKVILYINPPDNSSDSPQITKEIFFEPRSSQKNLLENVNNTVFFLNSLKEMIQNSAESFKLTPPKIDIQSLEMILKVEKTSKLDSSIWESNVHSLIELAMFFENILKEKALSDMTISSV